MNDRENTVQKTISLCKPGFNGVLTAQEANSSLKHIDPRNLLCAIKLDLKRYITASGIVLSATGQQCSHSLTKFEEQFLLPNMSLFSSEGFDVGTTFAIARIVFIRISKLENCIPNPLGFLPAVFAAIREEDLQRDKHHLLVDNSGQEVIKSPYKVLPRRIWDLHSNRVIEFPLLTIARIQQSSVPRSDKWKFEFYRDHIPVFWAITHSWTDDMRCIRTPINGYRWPVPVPDGVSLEQVRDELLTFGGRYVWLDVLCLRQENGTKDEGVRAEEWKIDVPTIGNIYRTASKIVRYLNGLGRPFSHTGWDNDRHWLQRAWTLQEIRLEDITYAGGVKNDPMYLHAIGNYLGKTMTFREALTPILQLARHIDKDGHCEIYHLAKEMQRRRSSIPLDKVTGLFYLLRTWVLPTYSKATPPNEAWAQSIPLLRRKTKLELLFDFPYPGHDQRWFPSWEQLLEWPRRDPTLKHVSRKLDLDAKILPRCQHCNDCGHPILIENTTILDDVAINETTTPGVYTARVKFELTLSNLAEFRPYHGPYHDSYHNSCSPRKTSINNCVKITFFTIYPSQQPIANGLYTLVTPKVSTALNWVVATCILPPGSHCPKDCVLSLGNAFRKVGILRSDQGISLPQSKLRKGPCVFI